MTVPRPLVSCLLGLCFVVSIAKGQAADRGGVVPVDASGRPLNLGFEDGTLRDWTAAGAAFERQPVEGDAVHARRQDMRSRHAGRFWIGSFERGGDRPQGTLTSASFKVTHPWASFLVAGGSREATRVEVVRKDSGRVIFKAIGDDTEDMKPEVVDLSAHVGQEIFLRLVDQHSGGWGHVNFDDFRFHPSRPNVPARAGALVADTIEHDGLSPEDAAKAMTVPPGFRVSLFAGEPDVVQPIAMALDHRGRLWVAEAYSYPIRLPDDQAHDRVLIFEDADGDGRFDKRTVFLDKLNLVSGLELGFGGVWIGAAPYLMFVPDRDGDDTPDGPPEILLDGWGAQDTHETLNSFTWGPDGWLYGCHGVFTHSRVGKPGTPDADRVPINAGIWRYHPTRRVFEVFAEGTSNPWGVDFDEVGRCVITACVIPHLYHMVQGGRFQRQAGAHFNPYTYDDIKTIGDHVHYLGATPHGGNGKSDAAGGGHAHAGALIYQGNAWPAEYRGSLLMNNIHGARLNRDLLEPKGSGLVGRHAPDFLRANDRWSQIVSIQAGPDGNVYMIDWYDKNQCHLTNPVVHDRTNGRVFKVSHGEAKAGPVKLEGLTGSALARLATHRNEWYVRHARRILQERAAAGRLVGEERDTTIRTLEDLLANHPNASTRLRALWALHAVGGITESSWKHLWKDADPHVRAWAVQLACEQTPPAEAPATFAAMAKDDPSPVVRLALASAAIRLPAEMRWGIVEGLVARSEDAEDHNIPLMAWYAAEPLAEVDPSRSAGLARSAKLPRFREFMARRIASIGTAEALALVVGEVGKAGLPAARLALLEGLATALQGRRNVPMPEGWAAIAKGLLDAEDARTRSRALSLALTFGDPTAVDRLSRVALDRQVAEPERREAVRALVNARPAGLSPTLLALLVDPSLRAQAIRGLASYDDPKTPEVLLATYGALPPAEKRDALATLSSRSSFARALLDAVGSKKVPSADLTADLVRQLRNLGDKEIEATIGKVWGVARDSSADKARLIAGVKAMLTARPKVPADPMLGRAVFAKTCGNCHKLFGIGSDVGPDLTGSNRADVDYVLSNVLDPSALIGKDYQAQVLAMADGRVLTGIVRAEDKDAITLATANETVILPKSDVADRKVGEQSMMPEGQWETLTEHEARSLVAYLASPAQVPMLATKENAASFFNGKDLAGWDGDPELWKVEGGEIVGKTTGLARNAFLKSAMAADDFRLTLDVRLVDDAGNSGIQFRSEALPDGEVRGYQADVGPGWWGKLYEENGRGLLGKESGEAHVKRGEWNTYEIVAAGGSIRTSINGKPCADLEDSDGPHRGIFALQLHSGGATEVRFRDIKLEVGAGR